MVTIVVRWIRWRPTSKSVAIIREQNLVPKNVALFLGSRRTGCLISFSRDLLQTRSLRIMTQDLHGFLNPNDPVAISFWIISISMVAATTFFLMEIDLSSNILGACVMRMEQWFARSAVAPANAWRSAINDAQSRRFLQCCTYRVFLFGLGC